MIAPVKINRLQHIGLPITDLAASKAFYTQLGFTEVMSSTFEHAGATGLVSMMQLGDITLELYQMPEPELSRIRARGNGHIDHIAFDVDDIETTFTTLKTSGYDIDEPAPVFLPFWKNGCKYFNLIGPDGERLEFNQIL